VKRRESGIAALTAILVVAVAASAAAMMLSQQSAMLDQTMLVASRAQAEQYASAGLDWARGVLVQDGRASQSDSLDEGWARPIVGLPVERAVVAGGIADEQGKFNLNNLVDRGRRSEADIQLLRHLLTSLALSPDRDDPNYATPAKLNSFAYHDIDPDGDRCPVSSHVRRANPRDARGDDPKESNDVISLHRLLARGRSRSRGRELARSVDPPRERELLRDGAAAGAFGKGIRGPRWSRRSVGLDHQRDSRPAILPGAGTPGAADPPLGRRADDRRCREGRADQRRVA
jgi:hypothetical protein